MSPSLLLFAGLLTFGVPSSFAETNAPFWNQFRGPNGSGVANAFRPPVKIDAARRAWKTPLPTGKSSPVLWNDRIFVTGVEEDRLVTLALDRISGAIVWKGQAPKIPMETTHAASSPAASTPCVDAHGLYVYFGSFGLLCYDHEGKEKWSKAIPSPKSLYGMSTSPIRQGNLLILVLDDDANLPDSQLSRSKVIALEHDTGKLVWETARPFHRSGWSTPTIWKHERGTDLAVLGNGRVYGYDPATGAEKWYVNGFSRETIAVPVVGNGRLHVSSSMLGGRGDEQLDPEPFWKAMLQFDLNGDGRIDRSEVTEFFTFPLRPELPPGHPGFGLPLPGDADKRKESQKKIFAWRDQNKDGLWTREEFVAELASNQVKPNLAAIRPGGDGDITETHVAWNLRRGIPEIPSPIFHKDRLYLVRDGGILSCVHAETGDVVYQERTGATGQYTASPVVANDYLYLVSAEGVVTVVKTGDAFALAHQAKLGPSVSATPALDENTLYIRTADGLISFR